MTEKNCKWCKYRTSEVMSPACDIYDYCHFWHCKCKDIKECNYFKLSLWGSIVKFLGFKK